MLLSTTIMISCKHLYKFHNTNQQSIDRITYLPVVPSTSVELLDQSELLSIRKVQFTSTVITPYFSMNYVKKPNE